MPYFRNEFFGSRMPSWRYFSNISDANLAVDNNVSRKTFNYKGN
jgi:hypothetical protein